MRKFKFFLDFEKEANWLNQMAEDGYEFVGKSLGYQFRHATPEMTNIKIDYRSTFKTKADFEDYCTLFEDCGWKHIAGTKSSGAQYFKKVRTDADEDIFSDLESKAFRYRRLSQMYFFLAICSFLFLMVLFNTDDFNPGAFLNPKQLYFTPGLWEMGGIDFWGAFLFETPFANTRGFIWMLFPVTIALYLFFGYKAERKYKKTFK